MYTTAHMQSISATQARQNFFDLLTQTQDQESSFAIKKRGKTVAYLTFQLPATSRPNVMEFAGLWGKLTKKDQQDIKSLYRQRRSAAPTRHLPTF